MMLSTCCSLCVFVSLSLFLRSRLQLVAGIAGDPSCRAGPRCQLYRTVVAQGLAWLGSGKGDDDRDGTGIDHGAGTGGKGGSAANVSRSYVAERGLLEDVVVQMVMTSGRHAADGLGVRGGEEGRGRRAGHADSGGGVWLRERWPRLDEHLAGTGRVR